MTRCCEPAANRLAGSTSPWPDWSPTCSTRCRSRAGPGLAANQIGSDLAAFSFNADGQLGYVINPAIVEQTGDQDGLEACLSIPGVLAQRHRSAFTVVEGVDMHGQPVTVAGTGELARCLEHETAHLHGELFIDGLGDAERRRVTRQLNARQLTTDAPGGARSRP